MQEYVSGLATTEVTDFCNFDSYGDSILFGQEITILRFSSDNVGNELLTAAFLGKLLACL